jgi:beta-glucosidase
LDWLGVNYYTRFSYKLNPKAKDAHNPNSDATIWGDLSKPTSQVNSLAWEIYPQGLYQVLTDKKLKQLLNGLPIYITENGYCHVENTDRDIDDKYRIKFIQEHLVAVHKAIQAGVDIRGYFYWSLLDNFEWALGMSPRFGLVHVDHNTYTRSPKASYAFYSKIAKLNGISPKPLE